MISSFQRKKEQHFWLVLIPHFKGVCDKFKCTGNQYNMNTLPKTQNILSRFCLWE